MTVFVQGLGLVLGLVTNWLRPVLILCCGMLLFHLPTLVYKLRLYMESILYLLFCHDKTWTKPQDPAVVFESVLKQRGEGGGGDDDGIQRKTIYLVRHGESTWNDTFNKGSHRSALVFVLGFIPGLIKAVLYELYLMLSGKMDSWFYDAPLSHLGLDQVDQLAKFFKKSPTSPTKTTSSHVHHVAILNGDPGAPPSRILCSNLRRAISTMAAVFRVRLERRPNDKILIVPSLQEISRNPDALSITPAHTIVTASFIEKKSTAVCDFQAIFTNQIDMSLHTGNKPIKTNGLKRMNEFCDFCFSSSKISIPEDYIIVGGHSIWFRSFFRTYLPYSSNHPSKTRKIVNAGVVALTLMKLSTLDETTATKTTTTTYYMIDPKSIEVVYGGF